MNLTKQDNEHVVDYFYRIWGNAPKWCEEIIDETQIPAEGPVRDAWKMYRDIAKLPWDELVEDFADARHDPMQFQHDKQGAYCRAWLRIAYAEKERRAVKWEERNLLCGAACVCARCQQETGLKPVLVKPADN